MEKLNYLLGYENLYIYQDSDWFNFSLDSVLLPNFATINKNTKKILDIGTGNAVIPIILSTKTTSSIVGVEIQKECYELGIKSLEKNNLSNRIQLINDDIRNYYLALESDIFDLITCNPPYFKISDDCNMANDDHKKLARHELTLNLEDIFKISRKLLKNGGRIAIVQRPERLIEIISIMKKNNIEPKRMRFVYPRKGKSANILLIEGVKNGKEGLKIESPLYTYDNNEYTDEILSYFK